MGLEEDILAQHTFIFPSLSPVSDSHKQPYVRLLMFIKKRPDISDEKFHMWWSTVHADLAVSVEGFGGHCVRYVQLHQTASHKNELKEYGMEVLPHDGIGEMYLRNLGDWMEFQKSPAFRKLARDGANFMNGKMQVMMGYDYVVYGSGIKDVNGRDGILKGDESLKIGGPKL